MSDNATKPRVDRYGIIDKPSGSRIDQKEDGNFVHITDYLALQKQLDEAKAEIDKHESNYYYRKARGAESINDENKRIYKIMEKLEAENTRLREVLSQIKNHCLCTRNVKGFDYHEDHKKLGLPKSGSRWLTPVDIIREALKQEGGK